MEAQPHSSGFASIAAFSDALLRGATSSAEVVRECLNAIDRHRALNALTLLNPSALDEAAALDREYRERGPRSRLHGVPIVVKDNIDLAGLPTMAGSAVLRGTRPTDDAPVVAALKQAGAVIVGKGNMSEFAASNGRPGYSAAGGLTRNPADPSRHASGSSSGCAVAVAAGLALAALGTDTFGSVRGPASVTGCVSLRPGRGLLRCEAIFPLAPSFDEIGPIVRDAADLPIILNMMMTGRAFYRQRLRARALKSARLAVPDPWPVMHEEVAMMFERALASLRAAGAEIRSLAGVPDGDHLADSIMRPLADLEFAPAVQAYFDRTPGSPRSVDALCTALEDHAARYPDRTTSAETRAMVRRLAALPSGACEARRLLRQARARVREDAAGWLTRDIDAVLFPTHLGLPGEAIDAAMPLPPAERYNPMSASYLASALGFPEVTVPAGRSTGGLPMGLSFMGPPGSEQALMDLAFSYQTRGRGE